MRMPFSNNRDKGNGAYTVRDQNGKMKFKISQDNANKIFANKKGFEKNMTVDRNGSTSDVTAYVVAQDCALECGNQATLYFWVNDWIHQSF